MSKTSHIVARADEIAPGGRKLVEVAGRAIALFNLNGEYYAIADKCPHEAGSLCKGKLTGLPEADEPGKYRFSRPGEFIRCPWHGWEFDIRTGQSWCDPQKMRVRSYETALAHGGDLVEDAKERRIEGPYQAETYSVSVEEDYVVIRL